MISDKKLIVFDLDGTLTETKSDLKPDMAVSLARLLKQKKVAIIGGGTYKQFRRQFVSKLKCPNDLLANLFLFPTTATSFYRYRRGWKRVYAHELSKKDRGSIKRAFRDVLEEIDYAPPAKTYGKVVEDRKTQVTFSALGQDVVATLGDRGVRLKEEWTRKNKKLKFKIARLMQRRLPKLEVHAAGYTSIDVTQRGIDKAYGIRQIKKYLHVSIKDMLFVGDALFPGGNDYAAKRSGVECISVAGPEGAKKVIDDILKLDEKGISRKGPGRGKTHTPRQGIDL